MNKGTKKYVVISSSGSISPLGYDYNTLMSSCRDNAPCLTVATFNGKEYAVGRLSDATEKVLDAFVAKDKKYKRLDRTVLMAMYAADKAVQKAGLSTEQLQQMGVFIGSSRGATDLWEHYHKDYLSHPENKIGLLASPLTTLGNIASSVANHVGAQGFAMSHSMTCSTSLQAITNAVAWMKAGMAERFLVGGSEAPLTGFTLAQLESLGIYSKDTYAKYPCRPLNDDADKKNGMLMGEGASLLLLEVKEEKDLTKGDLVIEAVGYGAEQVPSFTGMTEEGESFYRSMKMAVDQLGQKQIDLVFTHSPGTIKGDAAELKALTRLFGEKIPALFNNKWKVGHTYAASGVLSIEQAILTLKEEWLPELPYSHVSFKTIQHAPERVMVNAAGFGGNSSSIVISIIK